MTSSVTTACKSHDHAFPPSCGSLLKVREYHCTFEHETLEVAATSKMLDPVHVIDIRTSFIRWKVEKISQRIEETVASGTCAMAPLYLLPSSSGAVIQPFITFHSSLAPLLGCGL